MKITIILVFSSFRNCFRTANDEFYTSEPDVYESVFGLDVLVTGTNIWDILCEQNIKGAGAVKYIKQLCLLRFGCLGRACMD